MPPGWTLLLAVKDAAKVFVVKLNPEPELSRNFSATSDGELTRVGTCEVEKVGAPLVRPTFRVEREDAGNLDNHVGR